MNKINVTILCRSPLRLGNLVRGGKLYHPYGSDFMRSSQLLCLIRPYLPEYISVHIRPFFVTSREFINRNQASFLKNSVVILLKNVAYTLSKEVIEEIRENSISLGVDHIDAPLGEIELSLFDFHIAASEASYHALYNATKDQNGFVGRVFHHGDPRLEQVERKELSKLTAVYLGQQENIGGLDPRRVEFDIISASNNREMLAALSQIGRYNFHIGLRPPRSVSIAQRSYKPFTKGANAALCGSNILVKANEDDVIFFLGSDYPFLVHDSDSPEDIFQFAEEAFGGAIWHQALERMRDFSDRVHPRAIAKQFSDVIASVV